MPLHAVNCEPSTKRSSTAHFDGVPEDALARRLSYDAPIDPLVTPREHFCHALRAVHRGALLITSDKERNRPSVLRVRSHELFGGGHHRRQAALHVGGATPI